MVLLSLFALAEEPVTFAGPVPDDGVDFFTLSFEVPEGSAEIEVAHRSLGDGDILDWGLLAPSGFRGWGGGNTENAVVGEAAASRSYLAGPIEPGTWQVLVGKAKLVSDAPSYAVDVTVRDAPTLAAEPLRRPYAEVDLGGGARWYAGDFHVHSLQSGDASASLDAIAAYATGRGLDFVEISDHNTTAALDWLGDAQDRWPAFLFVPGVEITTYAGHANGIGLTMDVPFTMGWQGIDFAGTATLVDTAGAVLSINHPVLDLGDVCIGCAWDHPVPSTLGAFEIATGGWDKAGQLFDELAIAQWDAICDDGPCPAALGGSDDHTAGTGTGPFDSPIGSPTTMVWAESLSPTDLLEGIRAGRTVVKLQGPEDPMIDLTAEGVVVTATVTGGVGTELHFVVDGEVADEVDVDADPFVFSAEVSGERVRAEVWVEDAPRTVTSHLFPEAEISEVPAEECGCGGGSPAGGMIVAAVALGARRRGRVPPPGARGSS